jgi:predicted dinucleotide-binding enzyme
MRNVTVVIGAGSIGQAIGRRVGASNHVLLADLRLENAEAAAKTLSEAGFQVPLNCPTPAVSGRIV